MKNSLKILFILLGCLLTMQCSSPTSTNEERPQVIVDQDITEDTVWESGKDYIIKKSVTVSKNKLLHIEAGTNINFTEIGSKVIIEGRLEMRGDEDKPVNIRFLPHPGI